MGSGTVSSDIERLLLLTPDFPPAHGGIQLVAGRLAQELQVGALQVATLGHPASVAFDASIPGTVRRLPLTRFDQRARIAALNAYAIAVGLRWRPTRILNMHITLSPAALALSRALRIPYVQYVHADEAVTRPRVARFALANAHRTIAVSEHARRLALGAGADPRFVDVIPPGVDLPQDGCVAPAGPPTVITVSRLVDRYKGHDVMIDAMRAIVEHIPEARWLVVGDGPLRAELEARSRTALGQSAVFTGAVSDGERDRLLGEAHVFAMPSRLDAGSGGEGFGIVYAEAAARGLPVVAGNVGGATDAVVHEETGLLVDPRDYQAIADALIRLLRDAELRLRFGEAGRQRAREIAWPRIASRVGAVLRDAAT
jgi:phosphatidylinositol alpha-1,6-mannosyltransferase